MRCPTRSSNEPKGSPSREAMDLGLSEAPGNGRKALVRVHLGPDEHELHVALALEFGVQVGKPV